MRELLRHEGCETSEILPAGWNFKQDCDHGLLSLMETCLAWDLVGVVLLQTEDPTSPELCYTSALPWLLLHRLAAWQERELAPPRHPDCIELEQELPGSIALLLTGHGLLGQKAACTVEQGRLLNFMVDTFVPVLQAPGPQPEYAEQVKAGLDQALYCLYAHPSKKSKTPRHLTDHNVSQVGLTWPRALVLYRYVRPTKLPEHDDVKTLSITADTESLLRRIVALVPDPVMVSTRREAALDYLTGKTHRMKGLSRLELLPEETRDLFYLLADYAFKSNSDMETAINYYAVDLTFNRERFDSWAALALAQGSKLDSRLNSCQLIQPAVMLTEIESVEMCYRQCLGINGKNSNLWIEFANFCYSIHSYVSRTLNNSSENLNFETFEKLELKKEQFIKLSLKNYLKTLEIFEEEGISDNDVDERWLLLFMIGKIKEKQGDDLLSCLEYFTKSIGFIKKNNVIVPRKINYNNPIDFSIEALEIFYRIHASILKAVAKAEKLKEVIPDDTCRKYYEILKATQLDEIYTTNSPKPKIERFSCKRKAATRSEEAPAEKVSRQEETATTIMRDVLEVMDTMVEEVEFTQDQSRFSMENLARLCLLGLEDVVFHFSHHFKALYRMSHYLHTTPSSLASPARTRQFLLAGLTDKTAPCPGLFGGRKPNIIFNEVWRIPVSEIDRPGSFAAHCAKALTLLLDVLKGIPDVSTLVEIAMQLRKPPSEDGKFLHEQDRQEILTVAATDLNAALRSISSNLDLDKERKKPTDTLELYKLHQKLTKIWPGKEKDIFPHLKEMYAAIKGKTKEEKEKITEPEVLKFCSSETIRLRALANPKPAPVAAAANQKTGVAGSGSGTGGEQPSLASLQQWGQILADQQRMLQFQTLLAISTAKPHLTPKDMVAFCGLTESDLAVFSTYIANIASMSSTNLAKAGITSSQLQELAKLAKLTGTNPATITSQASKQAQFEQDYLRQLMSSETKTIY